MFPTLREVRSARKRPKSGKHREKMVVVWSAQTQKAEMFEGGGNGVIRGSEGRYMDQIDRAGLKSNFLRSVRSETDYFFSRFFSFRFFFSKLIFPTYFPTFFLLFI